MDAIRSLSNWAFVLLAIWLIMWAIKEFIPITNPIYKGIMAVLAILAGFLFFFNA
jgi:hypothetical protein